MEHKRLVKVEFHDVLRSAGLIHSFGKLRDHLAKKYTVPFGENPLMLAFHKWPRKFSEQLFNPRRVIASTTNSIEDLAHNYDTKSECHNMLCDYMGLHGRGAYMQRANTGDCLNTDDPRCLYRLKLMKMEKRKELLVGLDSIMDEEWCTIIDEIVRRILSHLKHRPIEWPNPTMVNEFVSSVKNAVRSSAKWMCEVNEGMGMGSTNFRDLLNKGNLEADLNTFEKEVKFRFENWMTRTRRQTKQTPIDESRVRQVMAALQQHISFTKHDKEQGRVQIQCNTAMLRQAAWSITRQNRFENLGDRKECEKLVLERTRLFYSSPQNLTEEGKPVTAEICRVYGIKEELVDSTPFANRMTLTYKGHKDPPENRTVMIGCEGFETNENFYRKMHNLIIDILSTVQVRYLRMVEERGGGQKSDLTILLMTFKKQPSGSGASSKSRIAWTPLT